MSIRFTDHANHNNFFPEKVLPCAIITLSRFQAIPNLLFSRLFFQRLRRFPACQNAACDAFNAPPQQLPLSTTALRVKKNVSVLRWLGICGETKWHDLKNEYCQGVAETLTQIVEHFQKAAKELLVGLPGSQ
jgi:hypothetical protein